MGSPSFGCSGALDSEIKKNLTTIFTANVNGFKWSQNLDDMRYKLEQIDTALPDYVCIQEPNLDTTKSNVREGMRDTLAKMYDNNVRVEFSSSSVSLQNEYKPGGSLIYATGNESGRVIAQGSDRLGRWSWLRLKGKGRTIRLITAYQVCKKPTNKTGYAAYHQHDSVLTSERHCK